jgi:hypothetical protein
MKTSIVRHGLYDVGGIGGKPGQLINHRIRRRRLDCIAYRLRIECVSCGDRGANFAETIGARTGASHAGHLMAKRA